MKGKANPKPKEPFSNRYGKRGPKMDNSKSLKGTNLAKKEH